MLPGFDYFDGSIFHGPTSEPHTKENCAKFGDCYMYDMRPGHIIVPGFVPGIGYIGNIGL